jgi:hypothetical protein
MVGKMILPLLGGAPAVWNTCLLFFQAVLLLGYLYAYLSSRWLPVRVQVLIQGILIALAVWVQPIRIEPTLAAVSSASPITSVLLLLLWGVGLPFLVLSTMSPLLQRWFHASRHAESGDPYFLYSASNLGSLIALLGYPFLIEPFLRLSSQSHLWRLGYAVLGGLVLACLFLFYKQEETQEAFQQESGPVANPIQWKTRLHWVLLSLVPSGLLLAVTNYLTRDLSPIPLLWVVPLALYIGSFAIVFARTPLFSHETMLRWQPFFLLPPLALYFLPGKNSLWLELPIQLVAFFVHTMVCHGELVRHRPHPQRLTDFYLWIAVGGVLGGAFVTLLAPVVFTTVLEFFLLYLAVMALRPPMPRHKPLRFMQWVYIFAGMITLLVAGMATRDMVIIITVSTIAVVGGVALLGWILLRRGSQPWHVAGSAAVLMGLLLLVFSPRILFQDRSFFGPVRVMHNELRQLRILMHGVTIHGAQSEDSVIAREPLTYFHPTGPFGTIYSMIPAPPGRRSVGIVGLGTGSLVMYGQEGDHFTFYEIDPLIARIAQEEALFTYLTLARCQWRIVLGDARLSLSREDEPRFDWLVLDAFSSDSIPSHLLTREAMQVYKDKVKPGGGVAFHITNYYLDLRPVLAALITDVGWVGYVRSDLRRVESPERYISSSTWVVAAASLDLLVKVANDPGWVPLDRLPSIPVWTDDYSNLARVIEWPWSR